MSQITVTKMFVKSPLTSCICSMYNLLDNHNILTLGPWLVVIVSFQSSDAPSLGSWVERAQFLILAQNRRRISFLKIEEGVRCLLIASVWSVNNKGSCSTVGDWGRRPSHSCYVSEFSSCRKDTEIVTCAHCLWAAVSLCLRCVWTLALGQPSASNLHIFTTDPSFLFPQVFLGFCLYPLCQSILICLLFIGLKPTPPSPLGEACVLLSFSLS